VGKTKVVYDTFLRDVARQKLLNSADVSRSYSQNNTGTVFLRHGVLNWGRLTLNHEATSHGHSLNLGRYGRRCLTE